MRKNFIVSSLKLILIGVALGMLARFLLGDPVSPDDLDRQFDSPVKESSIEFDEYTVPDFPLRLPAP